MDRQPWIVRKLVALGLLGAVLGAIFVLAIEPMYARISSAVDRLESERKLIARYEAAIAGQREQGSASLAMGETSGSNLLLDGESEAVMAAKLQAVLREAGSGTKGTGGLRIASTRALPTRDGERLRLIGLEARLTINLPDLQRLLVRLDAARPVVLTETLQVTPLAERGADEIVKAEFYDVRLEIFGAAAKTSTVAAPVRPAAETSAEPRPAAGVPREVRRGP